MEYQYISDTDITAINSLFSNYIWCHNFANKKLSRPNYIALGRDADEDDIDPNVYWRHDEFCLPMHKRDIKAFERRLAAYFE